MFDLIFIIGTLPWLLWKICFSTIQQQSALKGERNDMLHQKCIPVKARAVHLECHKKATSFRKKVWTPTDLFSGSFCKHREIIFLKDLLYFFTISLSVMPVSRQGGSFCKVSISTYRHTKISFIQLTVENQLGYWSKVDGALSNQTECFILECSHISTLSIRELGKSELAYYTSVSGASGVCSTCSEQFMLNAY